MKENLNTEVKQLYEWQYGDTNGFYSMLYTLFKKADQENKTKLAFGFPKHLQALQQWEAAGDFGNDLFRYYGLIK